jgi:hypothetical protein
VTANSWPINDRISDEGARMSRDATRKLNEAAEALMKDLDAACWTVKRIAEIQAKISQTMDECLEEISALFPKPEQLPPHPTND